MSDKPNLEKTADTPLVEEQAAAQQPNFSQPIIIERKHSTGKGIATGALALSVLALGASGLLFVQGQNTFKIQEEKVHQELEKAALGESENARKLAISLDEQQKLNGMVGELDVRQRKNIQYIADIQHAYRELLQGRVNWLVDEVEVTLNLAAQQLTLSGNVPVAITALESIEQRLSRFEQAELLPIKKAVSHDLDVLKQNAASYMDISGTALKLDSLEKAVAGLPLLVDSTLQAKPADPAEVPESADFWTRTWNKTVHMLQSMMEIRKLDSNDAMLLTPEQIYFVRANLRLRLLDARLALLQHNSEIYKNNLTAVESTVRQYFDTQSPTTQKWLEELGRLNQQNLSIVSDDVLKDSQAAVRAYQTQVRTAVPVNLTPVEDLPAVSLPAGNAAQPENTPAAAPADKEAESKAASAAAKPEVKASAPAEASKPAEKPAAAQEAEAGKTETGKSGAALAGLAAPVAAALLTAKTESAAKAEPVKTEETPAVQAARSEEKTAREKSKPAAKKPAAKAENRNASARHKRNETSERQRQNRKRREAERSKTRKPKARAEAPSGGNAGAADAQ